MCVTESRSRRSRTRRADPSSCTGWTIPRSPRAATPHTSSCDHATRPRARTGRAGSCRPRQQHPAPNPFRASRAGSCRPRRQQPAPNPNPLRPRRIMPPPAATTSTELTPRRPRRIMPPPAATTSTKPHSAPPALDHAAPGGNIQHRTPFRASRAGSCRPRRRHPALSEGGQRGRARIIRVDHTTWVVIDATRPPVTTRSNANTAPMTTAAIVSAVFPATAVTAT